ncbi:TIGR00730 family Rossman fold protein [Maritimibacter sp. UBA3975]|uniref:LOG family protein n=1 Tax=Maritimibacter sp. UBA3975 TaxID=1946833 RepID=UPI000C0B9FF0|nr:TIGR00730 family Rossman fold protein [Maritimibacter sp. UBA3975]MAM63548.1 TIGR00730 family Rossman fold protein [Maritimibacter sp.]|tara:strand:- start:59672 stop:60520 length:849 start_codon:yes stop_codon:yes gene_type:complete
MTEQSRAHPFRDSSEDRQASHHIPDTPQTRSPTYALAFDDPEFLGREELRPVRLQLELLKPDLVMNEAGIKSTVVMFGGARIPAPADKDTARTETLRDLSKYYDQAREFARLLTIEGLKTPELEKVVVTGGGPGVMEAGSRGAADAGGVSIGLNIVLPHEQAPNEYVTPELCFNFHYFAIRKMHFLMRAEAVAVFPGGFGTLDELFESLTLIQTGRMKQIPILLFGREFWEKIIDWHALEDAGTISPDDLKLFRFVDTAEEAIEAMETWEEKGQKRRVIPGR